MRPLTLIGEGRNRQVYRRGNYVIKVPLNEEGMMDNYHEYSCQNRRGTNPDGIRYAMCRLVKDSSILVMQYAQFPGPLSEPSGYISHEKGPHWMDYIDCGQVGYNRFGQIVAYDYGFL
jgi:hypothetical protein